MVEKNCHWFGGCTVPPGIIVISLADGPINTRLNRVGIFQIRQPVWGLCLFGLSCLEDNEYWKNTIRRKLKHDTPYRYIKIQKVRLISSGVGRDRWLSQITL